MGVYIMKFHVARQDLIKGVKEEFNRTYPFLKIEFSKRRGLTTEEDGSAMEGMRPLKEQGTSIVRSPSPEENTDEEQNICSLAKKMLWNEFGLSDDMKVSELEILLQYQFGLPVQILRKSGNLWMETRMNRHWTLRQQNDHGEDIASGFAS
jgi:hypothetical protein